MVIRYPLIIICIIIIIIISIFLFKKKQNIYNKGTKIANTKFIKENVFFKKKMQNYKILSNILKGICLLSIIISSLLLARISKVKTNEENEYKRDIFLCMDVSGSVNDLNHEIVGNLKSIVKALNGERFGISIFNTSSVLVVPLTNDYDYVIDTLDHLKKAFKNESVTYPSNYTDDDYFELSYYISSGTLIGAETRGASLIGDGLASCVYDFPDLKEDKERTRIIIFSTDNDLYGTPYVTIDEASTIAKNNNVKVYSIATSTTAKDDGEELKKATEKTGGTYFKQDTSSIKNIVKSIEKESKSLIKGETKTYQIDVPTIPFIILLISIIILLYLDSKVRL